MEGPLYLYAKRVPPWKKRYFVLTGQRLRYYGHQGGSILGDINISECTTKHVNRFLCGRNNSFQISTGSEFLLVSALNERDMIQWINCIRDASGRSTLQDGHLSPSSAMVKLSAQCQEDEVVEICIEERKHLRDVIVNFRTQRDRLIVCSTHTVNNQKLIRGCVLIAINGETITEGSYEEVHTKLQSIELPSVLQFVRTRNKSGVLRIMPHEGFGHVFRMLPYKRLRKSVFNKWKEQTVMIEGDIFTYFRVGDSVNSTQILLNGCTVKPVHRMLAGKDYCFLLTSRKSNLLFQAADNYEMVGWIGALAHAIDFSNGNILDVSSSTVPPPIPYLNLEMKMDNEEANISEEDISEMSCAVNRELHIAQRNEFEVEEDAVLPPLDAESMIVFFQYRHQFVQAIQLMRSNTIIRSKYRDRIFSWGLKSMNRTRFEELLDIPLNCRDETQINKDIPRTGKWLINSKGVPKMDKPSTMTRLAKLRRVLHAYISSRYSEANSESRPSVYLQGMNGIAYVLLQCSGEDEEKSLGYLSGIIECLLPCVFEAEGASETSLSQTGSVFESIVSSYLPELSSIFESVGLPVFILAFKWLPTMFSDISLTTCNRQLRFDTMMAAWDICFLLGMAGVMCVTLTFLSAAQHDILELPSDCLAEDVGTKLTDCISNLKPERLYDGVCVVLNTCQCHQLKEMIHQHHCVLNEASQSATNEISDVLKLMKDLDQSRVEKTKIRGIWKREGGGDEPMMVRNLDTGEMYRILSGGTVESTEAIEKL